MIDQEQDLREVREAYDYTALTPSERRSMASEMGDESTHNQPRTDQ